MRRSLFKISHMDCPSEENLIRMKLDFVNGIKKLEFDLEKRELAVIHDGSEKEIESKISELGLGEKHITTENDFVYIDEKESSQKRMLWAVLLINFSFFIIEVVTGLISKSMGLVADGLDMFTDASVYGLSLLVVGKALIYKKRIAKLIGILQLILAVIGFSEVIRRFLLANEIPLFSMMIIISVFALIANTLSLILLQRSKGKEEAHIKASMICTSNDVIVNAGVIVAAILVFFFQSNIPDLLIGSIVFYLVFRGALRILKLAK